MSQTTGIKFSHILVAIGVLAAVVVLGPIVGDIARQNGHDPVPVEFVGFWQPGDNQVRFTIRVGSREETFRPIGPQHTHDDEAGPGTNVEVTITSLDETPVVISECYIEFGEDTHIEGQVTREGSRCHAAAIIPPG